MQKVTHSTSALRNSLKMLTMTALECRDNFGDNLENHLAKFVINVCNVSQCQHSGYLETTVVEICELLRAISGQQDVNGNWRDDHADVADCKSSLDRWLRVLELAADAAISVLGPRNGLTPAQMQAAESHVHAMVATVEAVEKGDVEAQTGAERVARLLVLLLQDLGINTRIPRSDTATALDAALDLLRAALDGVLEVYGPRHHLTAYTISLLEADLLSIEGRLRDIEHGRLTLQQGLVDVVDELFNLLRDCGVPVLRSADNGSGLLNSSQDLQNNLTTLRSVINTHRDEPLALPPPADDPIAQLQITLQTIDCGSKTVTLLALINNLLAVVNEFKRVLD